MQLLRNTLIRLHMTIADKGIKLIFLFLKLLRRLLHFLCIIIFSVVLQLFFLNDWSILFQFFFHSYPSFLYGLFNVYFIALLAFPIFGRG